MHAVVEALLGDGAVRLVGMPDADGAPVLGRVLGVPGRVTIPDQLPDAPGGLHLVVGRDRPRLPTTLDGQIPGVVVNHDVLYLASAASRRCSACS